MTEKISIQQAAIKVLQEVKKFKRGLTLHDIQKRTQLTLSPALMEELKANPHMIWNKEAERFIFKFKYDINSKEDIMEILADEDGALEINEEVMESYDRIKEDIEILRSEHQILKVFNGPVKVDVIYPDPHKQPDGISWEMDEEIKGLWNRVPRVDYVELRNYLKNKNIKITNLDICSDTMERIKSEEKKQRAGKAKKLSARAVTQDLVYLAMQMNLLNNAGEKDEEIVKVSAEDNAEEVDEKTQEAVLRHNFEKNPDEFRISCDIVRTIAHWFYDDGQIQALYLHLKQRLYREIDVARAMLLQPKQVGQIMVKLHQDMLLVKQICESGLKTATGHSKQFNVWTMDFNKFVNSLKFRLAKMMEMVKEEENNLRESALFCSKCNKTYKTTEVIGLQDKTTGRYHCERDHAVLKQVDTKEEIKRVQNLAEKVESQMRHIHEMIDELDAAGKEENAKDKLVPQFRDLNRKASSSHSSVTRKRAMGNTTLGDADMVVDDDEGEENPQHKDSIQAEANAEEEEALEDFDPKPLFFGDDGCVYLPVVQEWSVYKNEFASRLIKTVLDETAELEGVISGQTYEYRFTEHSLFLASTRGFSPLELTRTLKFFSLNSMPPDLAKLIHDCCYDDYYEAVTIYLNGKYFIKADEPDVLRQLLTDAEVRLCLEKNDIIVNTIEESGVTFYTLAIAPGNLERAKKASRECGYPLIDEFDVNLAGLNSLSRANLKVNVTPRDYQRAAVQKVLWNGFKAHSGTLILPCGAGKTLCGITVMCMLKKPTIIFCNSILALMQWKEQVTKWSELPPSAVTRFASEFANEWDPNAGVILTTYAMFSNTANRKNAAKRMIEKANSREWGLLILDEVHLAPAKVFRQVANNIKAHIKLGLTATAVREDDLIEELPNLVGPKLYELDMYTLRMHNHIAPVACTEIHCPMTDTFMAAFRKADTMEERRLIYTVNPNKFRIVGKLIKDHLAENKKIMVFCDNLFGLKVFAKILNKPKISGETPTSERAAVISNFRNSPAGDCVLFSTVGDQSIDLPEADVVIQIALMHGSRMQEGQRIGRVQRPMAGKKGAFFYSIVCLNTNEVEFAENRRHFLERMGYTVTVYNGKDDWTRFVSAETAHILNSDMQARLLSLVDNELKERDTKRKEGAEMTEQGYEDLKQEQQLSRGLKRAREEGNSRIDRMRKKARKEAEQRSIPKTE